MRTYGGRGSIPAALLDRHAEGHGMTSRRVIFFRFHDPVRHSPHHQLGHLAASRLEANELEVEGDRIRASIHHLPDLPAAPTLADQDEDLLFTEAELALHQVLWAAL